MMTSQRKIHLIAAGLILRGEEILLVEQQGPNDPKSAWALPGGKSETGELLTETLVREVKEETGLTIVDPGQIAYVVQFDNPNKQPILENLGPCSGYLSTTVVFGVDAWKGALEPADPDQYILNVQFVPKTDAIHKLENTLHFRAMREPIVAYLKGDAERGSIWFYRRRPDGYDDLIHIP